MKYLFQFEFQDDNKVKYWLPLFIEIASTEEAEEKGKSIHGLLNKSFDKITNYSLAEYESDTISNKILENYIEDERNGEFSILKIGDKIEIIDVDDNADRKVSFDKNFSFKSYDKELISYLDFNNKSILIRNLSDNINNFDEYLIIKLKRKAGFIKMDPKKSPKANLEKLRGTLTLAGLLVALTAVYFMVNLKFNDALAADTGQGIVDEEDDEIIPITEQNAPPPPPPPPPPAPEIIEIVEDDQEVEDMIMEDTEADAEDVVEVFEQEEEVVEDEVFTIVENMPEIPGGINKYLSENVKFPPAARANGIQGKVYVNFTVGKDGKIRDIKILRGVHDLLDKEAIRVVKAMPSWKPGKQRGKPVSVSYNLPINFKLK